MSVCVCVRVRVCVARGYLCRKYVAKYLGIYPHIKLAYPDMLNKQNKNMLLNKYSQGLAFYCVIFALIFF